MVERLVERLKEIRDALHGLENNGGDKGTIWVTKKTFDLNKEILKTYIGVDKTQKILDGLGIMNTNKIGKE